MRDLLDSHTHTLMSGHAYSSIGEMLTAAKEKDLELIAFTEHAPGMPDTTSAAYFSNLKIMPRRRDGLWTLYGVELNILDRKGTVDLDENILKLMDVGIASIHPNTYQIESDQDDNTAACIRAMMNPFVNIIGHPDDSRFPVNYGELVRAAKAYHVLLEVNNSSFQETSYRVNTRENCRHMLSYCKKYDQPIIINSDAHVDLLVGDHADAWELIREVDFPERLVVNTDLDLYFDYVNYNQIFSL